MKTPHGQRKKRSTRLAIKGKGSRRQQAVELPPDIWKLLDDTKKRTGVPRAALIRRLFILLTTRKEFAPLKKMAFDNY